MTTNEPPCFGLHRLFDSAHPADHERAAKLCGVCPAAQFAVCQKAAADLIADGQVIEGTWAGRNHGGPRKKAVGRAA